MYICCEFKKDKRRAPWCKRVWTANHDMSDNCANNGFVTPNLKQEEQGMMDQGMNRGESE